MNKLNLRQLLGLIFMSLSSLSLQAQNSYNISTTTVSDTAGYLYDDGGPTGNYGGSTISTFTIDIGQAKTLKLQWLEFDVETSEAGVNLACPYDYVEIFEGPATVASPNMYCGKTLPPNFEAPSGVITVRFTTDGASEFTGFKAYWTTGEYLPAGGSGPTPGYCPANVGTECDISWTKRVNINNVDNDNKLCDKEIAAGTPDGYSDYTSDFLIQFRLDSAHQVIVEIGGSLITDVAQVWVDWNQDGVWELSNEYLQLVGDGFEVNLFTGILVCPPTAVVNKVGRLRVITDFSTPGTGACDQTYSGEVEDYNFIVLPAGANIPACVDYATASPANNSIKQCLNQTLRWQKAASATSYLVTLENTATGVKIYDRFSTTDNFLPVNQSLAPNTKYRWKALAVNGSTEGYECDSAEFTTAPNPDPIASILPDGDTLTACIATSFALNGNPSLGSGTYTHSWTGSGSANLSANNIQNPSYTSALAGTEQLIYLVSDENNCTFKDSVIIKTINAAQAGTPVLAGGSGTVCQDVPFGISLSGDNGTISFEYSTDNVTWMPLSIISSSGSNYTMKLSAVGTAYIRSVAQAGLCINYSSTSVTVNIVAAPTPPSVSTSGSTSFCQGGTLNLSVSNYSDNLQWSNGTLGTQITVSQSGEYTVTYIGAACPSTSSPITVVVNPLPEAIIEASGPLVACADEGLLLFGDPKNGESILWSSGETTKGITPTQSGPYSFTITDANGCTKTSASLSVTIKAVPAKPVITYSGNPNPCQGEPVVLTSSYTQGNVWSNGASTASINVLNSGSFSVRHTATNGCSALSDPTVVSFRPAPVKPKVNVNGKTNTCIGDSVILSLNVNGTPIWNDANSTVGLSIVVKQNGAYYAQFTNSDGCQVYSDTVNTVFTQFQEKPQVQVKGLACEGSTVLLVCQYPNGNTWNDANQTQNDTLAVTQSGSYVVTNVQNGVCTAVSNPVQITFEAKPSQPAVFEQNDSLYSSVLGSAYQWLSERGPLPNSNSVRIKPAYSSTYQVIVYSPLGCASPLSAPYYKGFTGIKTVESTRLQIFPNPFHDEFTLLWNGSEKASVMIYDALGRLVQKTEIVNGYNSIELQDAPGVYTLIISDNQDLIRQQITKN